MQNTQATETPLLLSDVVRGVIDQMQHWSAGLAKNKLHEAVTDVDRAAAALRDALAAHEEPVRVVIDQDGGVIHRVRADRPVEVVILDGDTDGADDEKVGLIDDTRLYISVHSVDDEEARLDRSAVLGLHEQANCFNRMHHRGHFKWIDGSGEAHWNFPISVDPETGAVDLLDREGLTGFPGVSQYLDLGAGSATYPLISVSGGWALTKEDLKSYLEDGERANLELAI